MTEPRSNPWAAVAAAFALGAGLVHAAAAGTHARDTTLVWLFATTALVQGAAGAAILIAPSRRNLLLVAAVNLAAVGAWSISRTVGLPVIDSLAGREAVGLQDLTAAVLAGAAVLAAVVALRPRERAVSRRPRAWLPALAILPAVIGMAAPHAHGDDHGDDHSPDHSHGTEASALAADPVFSGADTSHATDAELEAGKALVEGTRAALDPTISPVTTTAGAEAAGYIWIGDGSRSGFQHYVNPQLLADGRVLDPGAIEALVFQNATGGPVLVSAMYVLERGATMADAADVAGDLTVWHDHQNLCWDETGTRLAGVSLDGQTCRPGGELRATSPMLHVWLSDHECGPFAGVEGHGSETCSAHVH